MLITVIYHILNNYLVRSSKKDVRRLLSLRSSRTAAEPNSISALTSEQTKDQQHISTAH